MSIGKLIRDALPFSNVAAASVATNVITPGRTIENIKLKLGGTTFTKALISLVKVKANGKVIVEASATNLDKLNAYRGETTNANYLDLPFADFSASDEFSRQVGAFDTSLGIANITTEITIGAAVAPTLKGILTESAVQKQSNGTPVGYAALMSKLLSYPFAMATGGRLPVTVPFGPQNGAIIRRFHVVTNGGLMTGATVKQDGLVLHESLKAENEQEQVRFKRVPQTNIYTIDFVLDGVAGKGLDTRNARSLEWLLDFSAAESGTILVEYLDTLGNL